VSFFDQSDSSFYHFLNSRYPHLLAQQRLEIASDRPEGVDLSHTVPHGTTVLAMRFQEGVVIAGDRMATEGYSVSARRIEKVYKSDEHSAMAIAGAAGPCIDMARLFQTELEHYEKLEGAQLSTEGKANKLAQMIKGNLPLAMQGLVVVPIFASYDLRRAEGRIFKYDIAGGQYEETEFYSTGSGGRDARNTIKKFYRKDLDREQAIRLALEALYDAADEDIATGGPDLVRGIYPTVKVITKSGVLDVEEETIRREFDAIIEKRRRS
jgi:proteasome beta subunit